jgi:adenine-specific DNA-methyltransferase
MGTRRQSSHGQLLLIPEDGRSFDFPAARADLLERATGWLGEERIAFARAVTATVTAAYWAELGREGGRAFPIRLTPVRTVEVQREPFLRYAEACALLPAPEAFFQLGELYTSLLPSDYRTRHGIYYTPPALVGRLLDLVEAHGIDWSRARVLDPACGGAAFAAYVAERILRSSVKLPPEERLRDLSQRLTGFDVDPFAAWLSAVLLDVVCLPIMRMTNQRLDDVIRTGDTLCLHPGELGLFDLVIGNPPYGKTTLPPDQRLRFGRSLYGHANLYGVFTDLAVSVTRPGGLIAYVTPTSFLAGEYFKKLRGMLAREAPPCSISFVSDREGVFAGVLQETMLTVARRKPPGKSPDLDSQVALRVENLRPQASKTVAVERIGRVSLLAKKEGPWLLPRSAKQVALVRILGRMAGRLSACGYRVATGQLVWNRHKAQFRERDGEECYPVLWAECILPGGVFEFRAHKREHRPYIRVPAAQRFLLNRAPCVLVQRTTSKEQSRRLAAAMVPADFVAAHPAFVVENHVNMLLPLAGEPGLPLDVLNAVLNSKAVDEAFRCISGSVAVSAYELENLPLPPLELLLAGWSAAGGEAGEKLEQAMRSLYQDA